MNNSTKDIVLFAAVILLLIPGRVAGGQSSSMGVAEAQRQLLRLTVPDSMNTEVPVAVRDSITAFKEVLAAQTDAVILPLPTTSTASFAGQHLVPVMPSPAAGSKPYQPLGKLYEDDTNKPTPGLYGGELAISVTQPKPSLLLVREQFDIACGTDNLLLVYSNTGGAWKRVLRWQSKPYTSVGEAFGDTYETLLLQPERHRHPLLLVLHGTPWCTSTVSGFGMDVFELGASLASAPLWHGEHGYRRADLDPPLTLRTTDDGFEVRTSVGASDDRISRKGVMRYAVANGGVHRVEPIAMNAHDSVEEWLQMPRAEAAEFADGPAASLTWTMFQQFSYRDKPEGAVIPSASVGAVRGCADDPAHFQADVTSEIFDPAATGSKPGPAYFVQLHRVSNGYRIHAVTRKKDTSCTGPDLMFP